MKSRHQLLQQWRNGAMAQWHIYGLSPPMSKLTDTRALPRQPAHLGEQQ
ncbi:MAG: hypothetical protein HON25_05110 [Gammaproteobacteria bacterium]|nr:hypothetical protein [Gammaproteobacteria bacterium]